MADILVIGGGITGLTVAYRLKQQGYRVTVLERTSRVGGWIQTEQRDWGPFEHGPRSCRSAGTGQTTLALVHELGLTDHLVWAAPAAKRRFLYTNNRLRPISPLRGPHCMHILRTLWQERSIPPTAHADESVYAFFFRRFSPTIAEVYAASLTNGIYAGDTRQLSARACFPQLWAWEQQFGSIVRAFVHTRLRKMRARSALFTFCGGMETLPKALANRLGSDIVLDVDVSAITVHPGSVTVQCNGRTFEAAHLFATLPPEQLRRLLPKLAPWPSLPRASVAVVTLCYLAPLPRSGFGYLVPPQEQEPILGVVWDSNVFPSLYRPPTVVTIMIGGVHAPHRVDLPNAALIELAQTTLARHLAIQEEPIASSVAIAKEAIPQYPLGHTDAVQQLQHTLAPFPITALGSGYTGVSVNDCVDVATTACAKHGA